MVASSEKRYQVKKWYKSKAIVLLYSCNDVAQILQTSKACKLYNQYKD